MGSIVDDTIGAYNVFIQNEQATADANLKHFLSVIFNGQVIRTTSPAPVADVVPLNRQTYVPAADTPLYDAIGRAIRDAEAFLAAHPDFVTGNNERVLFAIITDGQENSSHSYTRAHIFDLLTEKQHRGWGVVYLGANQDAFAEAGQIGVSAGGTSSFATGRMRGHSDVLSHVTERFMTGRLDLIDDDMRRDMMGEDDPETPPTNP
jgi:hypothetical protein